MVFSAATGDPCRETARTRSCPRRASTRLGTGSMGTGTGMRTISPRHLRSVHTLEADDRHVVVETREHEVVEIEGCSQEELQAKLHDLEAWAS